MNETEYLNIEQSQSGLYSKFYSLRDRQLSWYEKEALRHFNLKKFPSIARDDLIRQILGKSKNDQLAKKKNKKPTYYIANAVAYLNTIQQLLTDNFIEQFTEEHTIGELVVYNYHRVFHHLLVDSLDLLNEYNRESLDKPGEYKLLKNKKQHHFTLYQSLKQSIFGQASFSFHSFREVEPDLSISIIRQLIELRLRRAFGILGWYKPENNSEEPLPMNQIFEAIAPDKEEIDFSMPLDCLIRIYGWSNIFLHMGIKDRSWKPIVVKDYLHEFACGKKSQYNVDSGITFPREVLSKIVDRLKEKLPKGAEVITCEPEADITDSGVSSSSSFRVAEPLWMQFAGIFEGDPDFQEIMTSIRAERTSDDDSEVDPSSYL